MAVEVVRDGPTGAAAAGVDQAPHVVHRRGGGPEGDRHGASLRSAGVEEVGESGHDFSVVCGFPLPFFERAPQHVHALFTRGLDQVVGDGVGRQILVHAGHRHDGRAS